MRMFTNYRNMGAQAAGGRGPRWLRALLIAAVLGITGAALLSLSGCGFKAQGFDLGFGFNLLKIQGDQAVAKEIQRTLRNHPSIRLVEKSTEAEVILEVVSQSVNRTVVAFNSAGRPREIQLRTLVIFRVSDRYGVELVAPRELSQTRDISVSESEALALERAEDFMRTDMNRDIAQQLIRRLRAVKLPTS
jgi:LPS-assembly lipoprotein